MMPRPLSPAARFARELFETLVAVAMIAVAFFALLIVAVALATFPGGAQ